MGDERGGYLSLPGTTFEERALPPGSLNQPYLTMRLTGELPPNTVIEVSEVAPAFGQQGGGLQIRILDPSGQAMSITELRKQGIIEVIGDTAGLLAGHAQAAAPLRTIRIGTAVPLSEAWDSMTDQQSEDDAFAADMLLIDELVDELGLDRWPGDSETILEVGNLEDTRILAIRHGLFTSEMTSRGVARQPLCSTPPGMLAAT